MRYTIVISESAFKQLVRLPITAAKKVQNTIDALSENPRPSGVKKLKGAKEDFYRVRVGDYRIIYAIDDAVKIVDVRKIGNRKDIYR